MQDSFDWKWQLRHAIRTPAQLRSHLLLSPSEERAFIQLPQEKNLPFLITPHFLKLMNVEDPEDPLRLQVVPREDEFKKDVVERRDPLGEEAHEIVPYLIHRYPDRVLLLVTDRCASYCRFCTRKRWVGQGPTPHKEQWADALAYVRSKPAIKEVILSGGDALMLADEVLHNLLQNIRGIPSVEVIRLASRMLVFAPMRFSDELLGMLRSFQPVYLMSHINHPHEIDELAFEALNRLADAGIPVMNQTVLLKGVNDDAAILKELFRKLVRARARPYYLHQCDLAPGTAQFRVPIARAMELLKQLRGHISGLCMPTFVIDIPGGYGKVPLAPHPVVREEEGGLFLEGFDGEVAFYPYE